MHGVHLNMPFAFGSSGGGQHSQTLRVSRTFWQTSLRAMSFLPLPLPLPPDLLVLIGGNNPACPDRQLSKSKLIGKFLPIGFLIFRLLAVGMR